MSTATLKSQFDKLKQTQKELKQQLKDAASAFFKDASAAIFEKYPLLESFSWNQYTPYFNDGDTCYFGVNKEYITLVYDGEVLDYFDGGYSRYNSQTRKAEVTEATRAGREVLELLEQFDTDFYEEAFGDHVTVTVTRAGTETEEYDHD